MRHKPLTMLVSQNLKFCAALTIIMICNSFVMRYQHYILVPFDKSSAIETLNRHTSQTVKI
jgi:hypothetical protein